MRRHDDGSATVIVSMRPMIEVFKRAHNSKMAGPIGYQGKDPAILDALKPTKYIQSDAPEVKRLAKEAMAAYEKDPEYAIDGLVESLAFFIQGFVYDYIANKQEGKTDQLEATQIIRTKSGDCKHHAILTAALLRASGIPARVATGLAYRYETNTFSGHAWAQAYIDWKWIDLDPANNANFGFDAGHICLDVTNEFLDGFGFMGTWGSFDIERIDVEAAPRVEQPATTRESSAQGGIWQAQVSDRSSVRCRWRSCVARRPTWFTKRSGLTCWPTTYSARLWPLPPTRTTSNLAR